jgi:succinate dehydrogenase/fumarate reductase cytochrome b subunit
VSCSVQSRVFSVAKKSSGLPVVNHNAFPYQPKKLPRADSPWHIYGWSVANGFSIAHRVSGVAATGRTFFHFYVSLVVACHVFKAVCWSLFSVVYGGTMWYLLAGSAPAMVASFAALPLLIQLPIKAAWVVPNVFHALNGVRHLVRISLYLVCFRIVFCLVDAHFLLRCCDRTGT